MGILQEVFFQVSHENIGSNLNKNVIHQDIMANLEENVLQNIHNKPLLYLGYINDIFLLWTHGEEELQ